MASPLSKIDHTTRAIRQSLQNNCFATLVQHPNERPFRVRNARKHKGVMQVFVNEAWVQLHAEAHVYQQ